MHISLASDANHDRCHSIVFVTISGMFYILLVCLTIDLFIYFRNLWFVQFGCFLVTASMFVQLLEQTSTTCLFSVWLVNTGCTLSFGALIVKTFRISRIFNVRRFILSISLLALHVFFSNDNVFYLQNIDMQTIAVSNIRLLGFLGIMILLDIVVLLAWSATAPFSTSVTSPFECIPAVKGFVFVVYD